LQAAGFSLILIQNLSTTLLMAHNPYDNEEQDQYNQRQRSFPRDDEQGYPQQRQLPQRGPGGGGGGALGGIIGMLLKNPRIAMALVVAAVGIFGYFTSTKSEFNDITGQSVRVPWGPEKDVALGMQAAPGMIQQHGGEHRDPQLQQMVDSVGEKLVRANAVGDWADNFMSYRWNFHLLADEETINAFALPGGEIFFTYGLLKRLKTEDQVAGVLGHEIGHVIGRHSAQQMAKSKGISGIASGVAILTGGGGQGGGGMGGQVLQHIMTSGYGRSHETESDVLGVQFMVNAGYNPDGLVDVMKVLKEAAGGQRQPEFMSSHPDPGNRIEVIKQTIEKVRRGELKGPQEVRERANTQYDQEQEYR
jgi:predicted Zn-dependent protease